ncbi:MAG TPA: hypothetical protein VEL76_39510 [Gemmataceae bacterium]|nr:hypothetical protein [Gemmataceae bacterium]
MADRLNRRLAIKQMLVTTGGLATGFGLVASRGAAAQGELLAASGAGVNVKDMPSPDRSGTVPLRESFGFDAHYAQCIIEDNPAAFLMETFGMGSVVIQPHAFFMAMYSDEMRLAGISRAASGALEAKFNGQLSCHTYASTATVEVGSRTATEPALFEIVARDGGAGGGPAGDSFAFTVFFREDLAPVNYAIFGPNPTFTGAMVAGEITIAAPTVAVSSG